VQANGRPVELSLEEAHRIAYAAAAEHKAEQDPDELAHLLVHASRFAPRRILEIGSYKGGSLWAFRQAFPGAFLVSLDRHIDCPACDSRRAHSDCPRAAIRELADVVIIADSTAFETRERVTPLAGELERGEGFDLIFVDGGHDRATVESDFAFYCPLLSGHGLIAFHDAVDERFPAVAHLYANFERLLPGQTTLYSSKPGLWGIGVVAKPPEGG
jgi:predicted O-methyltransferase YrrM